LQQQKFNSVSATDARNKRQLPRFRGDKKI